MSSLIEELTLPEKKPLKRTSPRMLSVLRTEKVGDSLMRITLSGTELKGFPNESAGAHIKLFFPRSHQTKPALPVLTDKGVKWPPSSEKPITRTYSVRAFREGPLELDVEFVAHSNNSPASGWAERAKSGDCIGIAGPGGPSPLLAPAEWSLFVGDLSALPAISALLESLSPQVKGIVLIELDDLQQCILLAHSKNINVKWILRKPGEASLFQAIKQLYIPTHYSLSAFVAGESSAVVCIRNYLVKHYTFNKANLYAVPYWRRGQNEETYHADRHKIMDEVY